MFCYGNNCQCNNCGKKWVITYQAIQQYNNKMKMAKMSATTQVFASMGALLSMNKLDKI